MTRIYGNYYLRDTVEDGGALSATVITGLYISNLFIVLWYFVVKTKPDSVARDGSLVRPWPVTARDEGSKPIVPRGFRQNTVTFSRAAGRTGGPRLPRSRARRRSVRTVGVGAGGKLVFVLRRPPDDSEHHGTPRTRLRDQLSVLYTHTGRNSCSRKSRI